MEIDKTRFVKVVKGSPFEDKLKIVYEQQFPINERVSLEPFFDPEVKEAYAYVLEKDGEVLGFVTFLLKCHYAYIFYLATAPSHQGKGVGSRIVELVKERAHNKILFLHCEAPLKSEPERLAVRLRREGFYKQLGFTKVGKDHEWRGEIFQTMAIGDWDEKEVECFWNYFDPLWKNED